MALDADEYKPSILIIDDDAMLRLISVKSLQKRGFILFEACDATVALQVLQTHKIDLILSDVMMPKVDGFTFCKMLKSSPATELIPIILMTGLNDFESIEKAYTVGATDFAIKPVNWTILSHRIRYILRANEILLNLQSTIKSLELHKQYLSNSQRIARLGSWSWQVDSGLIEWSEDVFTLFGVEKKETPKNLSQFLHFIHPDDLATVKAIIKSVPKAKKNLTFEARIVLKNTEVRHVFIEINIEISKNRASVIHGIIQDITERELAQQKIQYMLHYDHLTGLPNRLSFEEHLVKVIEYAKTNASLVGILFLDIDQFKRINDTLGHHYGDLLLKKLATRLKGVLQDYSGQKLSNSNPSFAGMVARFSGDEFAIILPQLQSDTDASAIAFTLLNKCKEAFVLSGKEILLTVSIGISLYPLDSERYITLIQHADTALHYAKEQGRDQFKFFSKLLNDKIVQRMSLENALRKALEKNELQVYFQPRFNIIDKKISGAEALLRWKSSDLGAISPTEFIPIAEQTGLIIPIGYFVIHQVCLKIRQWLDRGYAPIKIAVNISSVQLKEEKLLENLIHIVDSYQLPNDTLELEITESILMENIENSALILSKCYDSDFSIAIDDFGTGYSSLNYLRRFSVSRLKIDQSFIFDVISNSDNQAIVKAIIAMSHNLGLQVTAEGIETEEQLAFLKANGCDEGQGFLMHRPMPDDEFEARIMVTR